MNEPTFPIAQLDEKRKELRAKGIKFRVYFRGPRRSTSAQDTLKADAVSFVVYEKRAA